MAEFENGIVRTIAPAFLDRLLQELALVGDVRHNVEDAVEARNQLLASRNDLRDAIQRSPQIVRPREVENWFRSVEEVDGKIGDVQRDYENRCLCAGSCSPNIFSSYAISRRAVQRLDRVKTLLTEYERVKNLTGESPPASCIRKPVSDVIVEDSRHLLDELLAYLDDDEAGIVSICGMAGVGKSELMRRVNNEFLPVQEKAEVFKFVIWVDNASSDVSAVQDEIAKRLKLGDLGSKDRSEAEDRAAPIFRVLNDTSFLALLDNLMHSVSLADIGIPNPVHRRHSTCKQKVIFTTRFKHVCGPMSSCRQIEVHCLDWDASWKLFTKSVGQAQIEGRDQIAQLVARECGGLPIALEKIGRAMSTKVQPGEWRRTADFLRSSRIHGIPGMETENTEMLQDLKKSYDHGVFNPGHRECFLCCALWPRGGSISKAELIDCWIGLGLISDELDGFSIISSLQDANLLLPGEDAGREVKLQEVVRDMALWIARDCGREESKWMVQAGVRLSTMHDVIDLCESAAAAAERVSLMHNSVQELPHPHSTLTCPRLAVLMLQHNNRFTNISGAFLVSAPALTYLDLSHTAVEELPEEVGTLAMLQYLNLSSTPLKALPIGLRNLGRLKHLFLKHTRLLSTIPVAVFRGMTSLRVIDMYPSGYMDWEPEEGSRAMDDSFAFEQMRSTFIKSLGITINSARKVQRLGRLVNVCTRRLQMTSFHSPPSVTLGPSRFKDLMKSFSLLETLLELSITNCDTLEQLVLNGEEKEDKARTRNHSWCLPELEHLELCGLTKLEGIIWNNISVSFFLRALLSVKIENCSRLRNVSWAMRLDCLRHLELRDCDRMESVVEDQHGQEQLPIFPHLMTLVMVNLPVLSSVCGQQVSFPCLEAIEVGRCDNLRRMHIKPQRSLRIKGTQDWWKGLQWDGESNDKGNASLHHSFVEARVV